MEVTRELVTTVNSAMAEVAALSDECAAIQANLEKIGAGALKEQVVTLKRQATVVESAISHVLTTYRRRRQCF